jgi:CelD/BcsL family acetyltransferase involved in cellulose biosynthesis
LTVPWIETSTSLKFRLGEITLFSVDFPCLALQAHFTTLTSEPMDASPPFESFSRGVEALMMQGHPIKEALPVLTRLASAIRYVPSQYRNHYTNLRMPFEVYLKQLSGKSRSTLVRKVRKFAELSGGTIAWREFARPDELQQFHAFARDISRKTYQERLLDAGLPEDAEFVAHIQKLAETGQMRGYVLFLHGKPVAYISCPIVQGVLLYQHVGYDPEYRDISPGTVLQYIVLERLMSEGTHTMFDFTEGEGQHKKLFATDSLLCANIFYFRPTLRNRMLLRLHVWMGAFSEKGGNLLDRLGLKARIKRLLRASA